MALFPLKRLSLKEAVEYIAQKTGRDFTECSRKFLQALCEGLLVVHGNYKATTNPFTNPDKMPSIYWVSTGFEEFIKNVISCDEALPEKYISIDRRSVAARLYLGVNNPYVIKNTIDDWLKNSADNQSLLKSGVSEDASKKPPNSLGRPSSKVVVQNKLAAVPCDDKFWDLPRTKQAEEIIKRCGKKIGEKNWDIKTVQRHIANYQKSLNE